MELRRRDRQRRQAKEREHTAVASVEEGGVQPAYGTCPGVPTAGGFSQAHSGPYHGVASISYFRMEGFNSTLKCFRYALTSGRPFWKELI